MLIQYLQVVDSDRISLFRKCIEEHNPSFLAVGLDLNNVRTEKDLEAHYLSFHQRNLESGFISDNLRNVPKDILLDYPKLTD